MTKNGFFKLLPMQKARPVRPRFLQQEKRRGKNEKGEKLAIYKNARSDIRAGISLALDLYGFIIAVNC
jgi:hypothetical protein